MAELISLKRILAIVLVLGLSSVSKGHAIAGHDASQEIVAENVGSELEARALSLVRSTSTLDNGETTINIYDKTPDSYAATMTEVVDPRITKSCDKTPSLTINLSHITGEWESEPKQTISAPYYEFENHSPGEWDGEPKQTVSASYHEIDSETIHDHETVFEKGAISRDGSTYKEVTGESNEDDLLMHDDFGYTCDDDNDHMTGLPHGLGRTTTRKPCVLTSIPTPTRTLHVSVQSSSSRITHIWVDPALHTRKPSTSSTVANSTAGCTFCSGTTKTTTTTTTASFTMTPSSISASSLSFKSSVPSPSEYTSSTSRVSASVSSSVRLSSQKSSSSPASSRHESSSTHASSATHGSSATHASSTALASSTSHSTYTSDHLHSRSKHQSSTSSAHPTTSKHRCESSGRHQSSIATSSGTAKPSSTHKHESASSGQSHSSTHKASSSRTSDSVHQSPTSSLQPSSQDISSSMKTSSSTSNHESASSGQSHSSTHKASSSRMSGSVHQSSTSSLQPSSKDISSSMKPSGSTSSQVSEHHTTSDTKPSSYHAMSSHEHSSHHTTSSQAQSSNNQHRTSSKHNLSCSEAPGGSLICKPMSESSTDKSGVTTTSHHEGTTITTVQKTTVTRTETDCKHCGKVHSTSTVALPVTSLASSTKAMVATSAAHSGGSGQDNGYNSGSQGDGSLEGGYQGSGASGTQGGSGQDSSNNSDSQGVGAQGLSGSEGSWGNIVPEIVTEVISHFVPATYRAGAWGDDAQQTGTSVAQDAQQTYGIGGWNGVWTGYAQQTGMSTSSAAQQTYGYYEGLYNGDAQETGISSISKAQEAQETSDSSDGADNGDEEETGMSTEQETQGTDDSYDGDAQQTWYKATSKSQGVPVTYIAYPPGARETQMHDTTIRELMGQTRVTTLTQSQYLARRQYEVTSEPTAESTTHAYYEQPEPTTTSSTAGSPTASYYQNGEWHHMDYVQHVPATGGALSDEKSWSSAVLLASMLSLVLLL